jgi:hypothetical protein
MLRKKLIIKIIRKRLINKLKHQKSKKHHQNHKVNRFILKRKKVKRQINKNTMVILLSNRQNISQKQLNWFRKNLTSTSIRLNSRSRSRKVRMLKRCMNNSKCRRFRWRDLFEKRSELAISIWKMMERKILLDKRFRIADQNRI